MRFKWPGHFRIRHGLPALAGWFLVLALAVKLVGAGIISFNAPVPIAPVRPYFALTPKEAARIVTESKLFGDQESGTENVSRLQVVGLMTGPQGFALVSENAGPANAFVVGEEVMPGVKLEKIEARHVELSNGSRLELPLEVQNAGIPENAFPVAGGAEQGAR